MKKRKREFKKAFTRKNEGDTGTSHSGSFKATGVVLILNPGGDYTDILTELHTSHSLEIFFVGISCLIDS